MKEGYSYHFDEAVLPVPAGFIDKSVQVMEWPSSAPGQGIMLVISRRAPFATFDDDIRRDIDETRTGLKACVVEADEPGEVGQLVAHYLTMRYVREGKALYHRQVFVQAAPTRLLTIFAVGPASTRSEIDDLFVSAIDGIRFRE